MASAGNRQGAIFRAILNDLKRTEEAAARELGVDVAMIHDIIAGRTPLSLDLIERAAALWPVNERDFLPPRDDAPLGAFVMSHAEAKASSRFVYRGGKRYYEYRDTAMSRLAPIRPEWIKILHVVDNGDPENASVEWNTGHFLYQLTYFVGEVNYYYEWEGRRRVVECSTGDSVFGLPYAPHSFTSRDARRPGLILALTFAGNFWGDALHELGSLDVEALGALAPGHGPLQTADLLGQHAANAGLSCEALADAAGLSIVRVRALLGGARPDDAETRRLADALRIPTRELLPGVDDTTHGVVFRTRAETPAWLLPSPERPSCRVRELAGSRVTPHARGLEVDLMPKAEPHRFACSLHEYGYNVGDHAATLFWTFDGVCHKASVEPGDSFYLKPHVPHWFEADAAARLLFLRTGGRTTGDAALEASIIGAPALRRVTNDTLAWFDQGKPATGRA